MLSPQKHTCQHELVGVVRDGEDVGRGLLALFASVAIHDLGVVHRQPLVGVDGDTEEARVGLWKIQKMLDLVFPQRNKQNRKRSKGSHVDHPGCVSLFEVVQHGGLVQVGHHGHVLDLVIFGRIHGEDLVLLDCDSLLRMEGSS